MQMFQHHNDTLLCVLTLEQPAADQSEQAASASTEPSVVFVIGRFSQALPFDPFRAFAKFDIN